MKHVLVIRLSALGDVAIMSPVLSGIAAANPGVRFTVAGPPLLQPLFEGRDNVRFLGLKKKQSFIKIYKALEAVGADTVVDLHKVNRVGFALMLLRLRHLFDFHFRIHALRKGRLSRWLFLHHWRRKPRKPQYLRYADVFRRAGLKAVPNAPSFKSNPSVPPAVGVAPFSQHAGKVWPWENVEQLVGMLAGKGFRVILFGSREEAPKLESLAGQFAGVESVAGKQPFAEELEIIRRLSLMVSMDSANMHFASALGVPVVSVWGATHPDFGFYGYGQDRDNALCADLPCQPCSAFGQKGCRYGDYRCLRAITPQMVFDKILGIVY
jgi:ADP-heptose:LPS heptosyltransferase